MKTNLRFFKMRINKQLIPYDKRYYNSRTNEYVKGRPAIKNGIKKIPCGDCEHRCSLKFICKGHNYLSFNHKDKTCPHYKSRLV